MHKDQIEGDAKDAAGAVKQTVGKAIGNDRMQVEGAAERVAGKVQKGVGDMKNAARDTLKK